MAPHTQSAIRETVTIESANVAHDMTARRLPPIAFSVSREPWRLLLEIGHDHAPALRIEMVSQISVGRADLIDDYMPELDLTPYGGTDAGVSRRHALIYALDGMLYVRDLCSTNGTRLNGNPLIPNEAYALHESDELEFAHVRVRLAMARPQR